MRRFILASVSILLAFLLQNSILWMLPAADVVPNILLSVTVTYGLICGKKTGMAVGIVCGLLSDAFVGDGGLGFYMLIYLYIGAFSGVFNGYIYQEEQLFPLLVIGLCDLGFGAYVYIFRFLIRGRFDLMAYLWGTILPEMIYTILASIIVYPLISGIDRYLILTKKRRTSSFV